MVTKIKIRRSRVVTNELSNPFSNHLLVNFTEQYRTRENKKPHKSEALQ
jgi:hypothetical protein